MVGETRKLQAEHNLNFIQNWTVLAMLVSGYEIGSGSGWVIHFVCIILMHSLIVNAFCFALQIKYVNI